MGDLCIQAAIKSARLEVAVATTTHTCRDGKKAHGLAATPSIALGRLLTAAGLVALTSKRRGSTSLQVITPSRLKQVFVDATHTGNLRGFVRNTSLNLPLVSSEQQRGRRELAVALIPGKLHVVRAEGGGGFHQGTVNLFAGEIDLDVEYFFEKSDQIPSALACEVLLDDADRIDVAAGVLVQAQPGGDLERLAKIREELHAPSFVEAVRTNADDATALLAAVLPEAVLVERPRVLQWKCRCSKERVLAALSMLHPSELMSMAQETEPARITCDLCSQQYILETSELERLFLGTVKAQG